MHDHPGAHPADQQDAGIDGKLHDRHIQDNLPLRFQENIIDPLAGLLQFGSLILFPDIRLDNTDRAHILLHGSVEFIVLRKRQLEIFHRLFNDEEKNDCQKHKRDQIYCGKSGIDQISHRHCTDHADRCTEADTQKHLIGLLQVRHIRGKPGHQSRRAELIQIRERECLDIVKHRLS